MLDTFGHTYPLGTCGSNAGASAAAGFRDVREVAVGVGGTCRCWDVFWALVTRIIVAACCNRVPGSGEGVCVRWGTGRGDGEFDGGD